MKNCPLCACERDGIYFAKAEAHDATLVFMGGGAVIAVGLSVKGLRELWRIWPSWIGLFVSLSETRPIPTVFSTAELPRPSANKIWHNLLLFFIKSSYHRNHFNHLWLRGFAVARPFGFSAVEVTHRAARWLIWGWGAGEVFPRQ